jgi:hypothetical protein
LPGTRLTFPGLGGQAARLRPLQKKLSSDPGRRSSSELTGSAPPCRLSQGVWSCRTCSAKRPGCLRTGAGGTPLRSRSGCLPLPYHPACNTLVGRFGQGSREIAGIAGFPGSDTGKRQKEAVKEGKRKTEEGRNRRSAAGSRHRSSGPRGSQRKAESRIMKEVVGPQQTGGDTPAMNSSWG